MSVLIARKCRQKSVIVIHIRYLTGEKPYGCELCSKKISSKSNLNQHTDRVMKESYEFLGATWDISRVANSESSK